MKKAELEECLTLLDDIVAWLEMRSNDIADEIFAEVNEGFDEMSDDERVAHEVEKQSLYDSHELKDEQREFDHSAEELKRVVDLLRTDLQRMNGAAPPAAASAEGPTKTRSRKRKQLALPGVPPATEEKANGTNGTTKVGRCASRKLRA